MAGNRIDAYENGKKTGAYLFYQEAIESLNEAAKQSEKGVQETTTYECVANFLLAVYRKTVGIDGTQAESGTDEKKAEDSL